MRTEPSVKHVYRAEHNKKVIARITRVLAIMLAFVSTFVFFFKLLFF